MDSPLGVYGGFYAIRRKLASALPEGTILDDMLQPLSVIRQGYRSVLDLRARVYDIWPRNLRGEFHRKVRTLAGNFQLLQLAPWLLSRQNRLRFELISHKLMRLLVPILLVLLFVTSTFLADRSVLYAGALAAQIAFYVLAVLGAGRGIPALMRIAGPASAFCMLNAAVVVGFYKFLFTRGPLWKIWTSGAPASVATDGPAGSGLERNNAQPAIARSPASSRGDAMRLKVTVVTPIFPIPAQPYRGHSEYEIVLALSKRADVNVVCPFPRYPKWFPPHFDYRPPDLSFSPPGVATRYFEYPALPGLTRGINGFVCANYLEAYFREYRPDVACNFWLYPEGYATVAVARRFGIPAVIGSIGSDLNRFVDPASRWLTRLAMKRATFVVTKSEHLRQRAIEMGISCQ